MSIPSLCLSHSQDYSESLCESTIDCDTDGGDDGDCKLEINTLGDSGNDTYSNCDNGTVSDTVIELKAFCDFEPIARRDLYLTGGECFLMSNITDNGTVIYYYAEFECDGSSFVMSLYEDDDECTDDSFVVSRYIEADMCSTWLYDGNETEFGFDVTAEVETGYSLCSCPTDRVSENGSVSAILRVQRTECLYAICLITAHSVYVLSVSSIRILSIFQVTSCDDSGANIPFGVETVFLLFALLFVAVLRE